MADPYRDTGRPNRIWQCGDIILNLAFVVGAVWKRDEEDGKRRNELNIYTAGDAEPYTLSNEEGLSFLAAWTAWGA